MEKKTKIKDPAVKVLSSHIKFLSEKQSIYRKMNDRAVKEAKKLLNDRLEKMNHLQAKMDKQAEISIGRIEFELYKENIATEIKGIAKYMERGIGIWILLQVVIAIGLVLLTIYIK